MKPQSVFLLLIGLALGGFALKLVADAGAFKTLTPHFAGSCTEFQNMVGVEDFEHATQADLLFASSDRRAEKADEETGAGAIYVLDLKTPTAKFIKIFDGASLPSFHPHGFSLFEKDGIIYLSIVNHHNFSETDDTVEVLEYRPGGDKAILARTLRDPLFNNLNDIASLDETRFFVTRDHGSVSRVGKMIEDYSRLGRGSILFFDGHSVATAAISLSFANGLALQGKRLWMAEMLSRRLVSYEVAANGQLKMEKEIPLGTAPDNVTVADDGSLWIGAHPNLFKLKALSKDHSKSAPAQVLHITNPENDKTKVEEVLLDDGQKIAAVSVARQAHGKIYLGTIYDKKVLACELTAAH